MSRLTYTFFKPNSIVVLLFLFGLCSEVYATSKSTSASGNWSNPAVWGGTTAPSTSDDVTISQGQNIVMDADVTVKNLTISSSAVLNLSAGKRLTVNGNLTINGNFDMAGGNITLGSPGLQFNLSAGAVFVWDPGINTSAEATLFTRGAENFAPTSTLIIKKWYSYTTALGSLVSGNFGNLTLNSMNGANAIVEWDQNNQFQTHQILGTLTIDQGWITLDKSGSITTTTLGNIVLSSVNSFLYIHNGNHPGTINLNTGSITNNGGTFYGISDGTGDLNLSVAGNFVNIGNVKLIMNTGIAGVGNGNVNFNVSGTYSQSTGDTRFIYNVATSTSGTYNATINKLDLSGGIFMGQTACHTSGGTCTLNITTDCLINFTSNTDKFRGTSLSSIGANYNNTKFKFIVGGDLQVSGPSASEFTTSASVGSETIIISKNLNVGSSVFSMNYGSSAAAHAVNLTVNGDVNVSGGSIILSRNAGDAVVNLNGNLTMTAGMMIIKASTGTAQMNVTGQYNQSNGTIYLHGNSALLTSDKVSLSVLGNFTQSGGTFSFDDNNSAGSATHELLILGPSYSVSGTGLITHAGAGTSQVFGLIRFAKQGVVSYQRTSGHQLQQVKQSVESTCTLTVTSGNVQVCSYPSAGTDYFRILTAGRLQLKTGQIQSEGTYSNSGVQVDSAGTLEIYNAAGLYNGTNSAAISSTANMNYFLHAYSTVEYAGTSNQTLTGTAYALTNAAQHKYGILKINLQNNSSATISESQVSTRTRLELAGGSINLNGKSLVIENGNMDAVRRIGGFVYSENDASQIVWNNMGAGLHEFPFGTNSTTYIPVYFTPLSGTGNTVSISTRGTATSDNQPSPSNLLSTVLSLVSLGFAENEVIDRWWQVTATGMTADVTLKYRAEENTLSLANRLSPLGLQSWNGISWTSPRGYGFGVLSGIGSVTITNVSTFSNWILSANNSALPVELSVFQVKAFKEGVRVDWTTVSEVNNDHFIVERSEDGKLFEEIGRQDGAGNSTELRIYNFIDRQPVVGKSFYRLKQIDFDGKFSYSDIKSVSFGLHPYAELTIDKVYPNPFDDSFTVSYSVPEKGEASMVLAQATGKIIKTVELQCIAGMNSYDFHDLELLQSGTYILRIVSNGESSTAKLMKK